MGAGPGDQVRRVVRDELLALRGGRKKLGFGYSVEDVDEALLEVEDIEAELLEEMYGVQVNYAETMSSLENQVSYCIIKAVSFIGGSFYAMLLSTTGGVSGVPGGLCGGCRGWRGAVPGPGQLRPRGGGGGRRGRAPAPAGGRGGRARGRGLRPRPQLRPGRQLRGGAVR